MQSVCDLCLHAAQAIKLAASMRSKALRAVYQCLYCTNPPIGPGPQVTTEQALVRPDAKPHA